MGRSIKSNLCLIAKKKYGELVHDSHHHEWLLQKLSECVATLVTSEKHGDDEDSTQLITRVAKALISGQVWKNW